MPEQWRTDPGVTALLQSDDVLLLLLAVMGQVAHSAHKQQKGQSPVPVPADLWYSSSSSSNGAAALEKRNRQQRRLQQRQRQQQQPVLRVPPLHQVTLVTSGLSSEADMADRHLGGYPFKTRTEQGSTSILRALDTVLRSRCDMQEQQGALIGLSAAICTIHADGY